MSEHISRAVHIRRTDAVMIPMGEIFKAFGVSLLDVKSVEIEKGPDIVDNSVLSIQYKNKILPRPEVAP